MTVVTSVLRQLSLVALTALACVSGALAASPNASPQAKARYQHDMAVCNSGQSNQSATNCRREVGSALTEANGDAVTTHATQYQSNALRRCDVHQGDDRLACEARILGQGDVTPGTQAGGLLRKSITVKPAQ